MKIKPVLKESLRLYKKNFAPLCLALLVQLVLRGIALSPLMFLADPALSVCAVLAVPLYILIVLPARQNYALALQDMMSGGSVFSPQLISVEDYGRKLLRGVAGMLCILLWSAVTIVSVVMLYVAYAGLVDVITLMRICSSIGGDVVAGLMIILGGVAASVLLILLGCAVHSGSRHAAAMKNRKLLKGNRLRLAALWFMGLMLLLPFVAVVVAAMGDYAMSIISVVKTFDFKKLSFALNMRQLSILAVGVLVLLLPVLPLKNMLPAVYLRMAEEKNDAEA